MPTFLASDLIASLQRDSCIAFTAEVGDRGALHRVCSHAICTESILAAEGGDLVGFAGHVRLLLFVRSRERCVRAGLNRTGVWLVELC